MVVALGVGLEALALDVHLNTNIRSKQIIIYSNLLKFLPN